MDKSILISLFISIYLLLGLEAWKDMLHRCDIVCYIRKLHQSHLIEVVISHKIT